MTSFSNIASLFILYMQIHYWPFFSVPFAVFVTTTSLLQGGAHSHRSDLNHGLTFYQGFGWLQWSLQSLVVAGFTSLWLNGCMWADQQECFSPKESSLMSANEACSLWGPWFWEILYLFKWSIFIKFWEVLIATKQHQIAFYSYMCI